MKKFFYAVLATSGLLFFAPSHVSAAPTRTVLIDNPAEAQRKAAAREQKAAAREKAAAARQVSKMKKLSVKTSRFAAKAEHVLMVVLGLEESKSVTSPHKLKRQLHAHQKQLKMRARMGARSRRTRTHG
jgi:hypothetical protein